MAKRLLLRIDDAGLNLDTNRGVEAAAHKGIARSVGIMACAPAFADASRRLLELPAPVAIGVHFTLNSEWVSPRWGPLRPRTEVPSLVDHDGFLPFNHQLYRERPPVIGEVIAELRAQIAAVRATGLRPCYADEHMGFAGVHPQLASPLRDLLAEENLFYARDAALVPLRVPPSAPSMVDYWCDFLRNAPDGDYLAVTHPSVAGPETSSLALPERPPGEISPTRAAELAALIDTTLRVRLTSVGVTLINYADLRG
jgi:predicted glycoside hydrolase/deacetylase ChbG (UPF0249 family)